MPLEFMAVMATVCFVTGIPSLLVGLVVEDDDFITYGVFTTAAGVALVVSPFVFHVVANIMGVR